MCVTLLLLSYCYLIVTLSDMLSSVTTACTCITSPPKSHLGRVRHYPNVGECTLPLHVLAVVCTMRNEALRERYEALMEHYETVTENIDFAHH